MSSTFKADEYFQNKVNSVEPRSIEDIKASLVESRARKLADLEKFSSAARNGELMWGRGRSLGEAIQDTGVTLAKGAVGLPQAFVGLADIPARGRIGKKLEEIGYRPDDANKFLDDLYSQAQQDANFQVQSADGFWGTVEAAIDNPSVIATSVGESLPQMLGGAAVARKILSLGAKGVGVAAGGVGPGLPGLLSRKVGEVAAPVIAGAVGEGLMGAGSAAAQIREQTEDGLLTGEQALSAMGSGLGSAVVGVVGGKFAQRLGLDDIDTAMAAGKLSSGVAKPAGFIKALVGAGFSEGALEEMPQSMQEQIWQNYALDKPLLEGVPEAGAMGLLTGAAMGGTMGGVSALASGDSKTSRKRNERDEDPTRDAALATAAQTGNVDALLNRDSKAYAPADAALALLAHSKQAGTTDEQREANLGRAREIVKGLAQEKEAYEYQLTMSTPDALQREIADVQAILASGKASDPGVVQQALESLQAQLERVNAIPDLAKHQEGLRSRIQELDAMAIQVSQTADQITGLVTTPEQVGADLELLSRPAPTTDSDAVAAQQQAAERIINLAMRSPERVDARQAKALANTAGNAFTEQQRKYLRAFSDARIAENLSKDIDMVKSNIWRGSQPGEARFVGILQYRAQVKEALDAGDQAKAAKLVEQMQRFNADHAAKAKAAAAAWKRGQGTQILAKGQGQWEVNAGEPLSREALRKSGSLSMDSADLVTSIRRESEVLRTSTAELAAAVNLKFPTTAGDANVPNSAQSPDSSARQSQASQRAPGKAPSRADAISTSGSPESSGTDAGVGNESAQSGDASVGLTAPSSVGVSDSTGVTESTAQSTESSEIPQKSQESISSTEKTVTEVQSSSTEDSVELNKQSNQNDSTLSEAQAAPTSSVQTQPETAQEQLAESVNDLPLEELSQESAEPESTQTEAGTLLAVQERAGSDAPFLEKKLGDFVAQVGKTRPLVAIKDFLDQVRAGAAKLTDYLQGAELDASQQVALQLLSKVARRWDATIRGNLRPRDAFQHEDPIRFLIKDGDLEQNVKTAMAAAALTWVADEAKRPINTNKTINSILGRDDDHRVSQAERALLHEGAYQSTVVEALGQKVMDALGFKALKDAPQNILPKLKMSLGAHTLKLLEDLDMVEQTQVAYAVMERMRAGDSLDGLTDAELTDTKKQHTFFKVLKDAESVREISDTLAGTKSVISNLFGIQSSEKRPSLTPVKAVQQKTDTGMGVPKTLQKVTQQNQTKNERHVNPGPMAVIGKLEKNLALAIAGVVAPDEHTHGANVRSLEAKNDGLERDFDALMEFIHEDLALGNGMDQGFFYRYDVWKQQRVGIENNVANPQTSKIARWLTYSKDWNTVIRFDDEALLTGFKLRVAEGLGVKTERGAVEGSVAKAVAMLAGEQFQAGLAAIRAALGGDALSAEQQQAIVAAVQAGGEKVHTLAALVAWEQYQQAREAKKTEFTTNLMGEVDGVANGTMLNHVLYGAGSQEMLERGGFYTQDSKFRQFNLWRGTPGNLDIYEATALKISNFIAAGFKDASREVSAIWAVIGNPIDKEGNATKDGRTLVKTALNPLNYGSGFTSVKRNLSGEFIDSIYSKFESLSRKGADQATINQFVEHLNVLLHSQKAELLPKNQDISTYLDARVLNNKQIRALEAVYTGVIGNAVEEVVRAEFGSFLDSTKNLIRSSDLAYKLYDSVYQVEREKLIEKLGIPKRTKRESDPFPVYDLTADQEAELQKSLASILPVMHTAMSQRDGSPENGILLMKREKQRAPNDSYEVEVAFGSKLSTGAAAMTVRPQVTRQSGPGVVAVSAGTHSLDSAISHDTQLGRNILNIHDALGGGIGGLAEMTQAFNQATFENLLAYSPLRAGHDALARVVVGLAKLQKEGQLTPEALKNIKASLGKNGSISKALQSSFDSALLADRTKLDMMSRWAVVDQYPMDNNGYQITDADRQRVNDMLTNMASEMDQEVVDAAAALDGVLGFEKPAAPAPATTQVTSPFGKVGPSRQASDADLVAFLRKNPDVGLPEMAKYLHDRLKAGNSRLSEFHALLLQQLYKSSNKNIRVKLITPETAADAVMELPKNPSYGWVVNKGRKTEIYVMSPEFAHSGLVLEVLMHELTHGALLKVVQDELDMRAALPDYKSEALELVEELERLQANAKAHVAANGPTGFDAAFENLHEFIAYGMTNKEFQRQVLSQVTTQPRTKKTELVKGMKAFIDSLVGLLFKGSSKSQQAVAVNGLTVLINNVSGLLSQAAVEADLNANADAGTTLNLSMAAVDSYTTRQVFDALEDPAAGLAAGFKDQLAGLLSGVVNTLHGPFGTLAEAIRPYVPTSPQDAWTAAQSNGFTPFASEVAANLPATQQELFVIEQVEATVKAALVDNASMTKLAYKELADLFVEAQQLLKPTDFQDPSHYDFIFKVKATGSDGKSDYLARFAALALAHQGLNKLLQVPSKTTRNIKDGKTIADKAQIAFEKILAYFSQMATRTWDGQRIDQKLQTLVGQLVHIEAQNREAIKARQARDDFMAPVEEMAKKGRDVVMGKVEDLAGSEFVRKSKNGLVLGGAAIVRTIAGNRQDEFFKQLQDFRDSVMNERGGLFSSLLNELVGHKEWAERLLRLVKHRENQRKSVITGVTKMALDAFSNGGQDLTDAGKAALTRVFMRSGGHTLLETFDYSRIQALLNSPAEIRKEIAAIEAKFPAKLRRLYVEQSQALGLMKAQGTVAGLVMPNAHVISRMLGTPYSKQIDADVAAEHEAGIKQMVTLFALLHAQPAVRSQASKILATELARQDGGNGVDFLLKATKRFEQDSLERLFNGNPVLMQHGYTPEIYNPHTDFKVVSEKDGQDLLQQGYKVWAGVVQDPVDPDGEAKRIYLRKGAALSRWDSGVFSLTDMGTKGTTIHNGFLDTRYATGSMNASRHSAVTVAKMQQLRQGLDPHRDMSQGASNHLVPVYNESGDIVNWRYMMQESTKDSALLERNNRFEDILGVYAGSIFDKQSTPVQNKTAIKALKEQHAADADVKRLRGYHLVGEESTDPKLREIWELLPEQAKQDVRTLWGVPGMWVHTDNLDIMFGYRAASAAEFLRNDRAAQKGLAKILREFFHGLLTANGYSNEAADNLAKKWGWKLAMYEEAWQEIVKEMKDIIVVKSGVVMLDNVRSNFTQLLLSKVPVKDMIRHHLVGMRAAVAFEKENNELQRLERLLSVDYVVEGRKDIELKIARLKDSLARNPVRELIEAGLMPTIVEDVSQDDDMYSYKGQLAQRTERFTKMIPKPLRDAGKVVYMAHDTKAYQVLNRVTRLSDFVARYALYQHLTTRTEDPMTSEEAIQRASETFINYDISMHRGMQYLDNMGLFMFTKYFLRVQRVLTRTFRENPARVLGLIAADHFMDIGPNVLEGSVLNHLGNNPWRWGAFEFPGALDKLATVSVPMSIIK